MLINGAWPTLQPGGVPQEDLDEATRTVIELSERDAGHYNLTKS